MTGLTIACPTLPSSLPTQDPGPKISSVASAMACSQRTTEFPYQAFAGFRALHTLRRRSPLLTFVRWSWDQRLSVRIDVELRS